ncbi:MAG: TlpA family protein disulfide reductase [Planctomycetes bacterium]|nr:TlpA family protein disulfide reductase [Planctomycetota bacterium]
MKVVRSWSSVIGVSVAVAGLWLATNASSADEPKPEASPPKTDAPAEPAKAESAEDLIKQLEQLSHRRPTGNSRDEFIASFTNTQREILEAAEKLLAHPDAAGDKGDKLAAGALGAKISALRLLTRLGDKKASGEVTELLKKYSDDKRPQVSEVVTTAALAERFTPAPDAKPEALKAMVADAKQYFAPLKLRLEHVMIMKGLTDHLEQRDANTEAADALTSFGELLSKSDDKRFVQLGQQFQRTARRLGLMGKPMEVYGTMLDGKQIDWKSYRGKVVLVDFWATWCGPCVKELPNIVNNFEQYHGRGFDVIGVSVDDDRQRVDDFVAQRKVPWTITMDKDFKAAGKEGPLAIQYGVAGIPTAILVDREGKVVSLNARGPELGRLLGELIGPPEKAKEEKKAEEKK